MKDWIDALAMEEARDAIEDAYEEASGDLGDRLFYILTALDEKSQILPEDLDTISEAICQADKRQEYALGDRLLEALTVLKEEWNITE